MIDNPHQFTSARCIRKLSKAFKCCGISVKIDRTKNDLVFNYDILGKNVVNLNKENIEELNSKDIDSE
ncbi:12858_t:CDS:2, partial [Cetraspora pellucida]